jgi:acetyl esterase
MSDLAIEIQRRIAMSVLRAPAPVLRAIGGSPRRSPEGYVLDPQTQVLLRLVEVIGLSSWRQLGVERTRQLMDNSSRIFEARPAGALSVRNQVIEGGGGSIALRFYLPAAARERPRPIVVFYHGGGHVLGSLDSHDGDCRTLSLGADAIVVSVGYRRAPEHPFPAAIEDGLSALRWVAGNAASFGGDAARIAVAGDSAGGNIAAVVAREARGSVKLAFQLLIYPSLDFTRSHPSHRHFREGYLLTEALLEWFAGHYLGERDRAHLCVSPLFADDHAGVPPAMILTAGFDPLRDEAKAYADKLSAAGVPVEYRCYEGLVHGFFSMSDVVDEARRAATDAVSGLRRALYAAT